MKHITKQELSDLMGYKNINSFYNSETNKKLLINLVNTIEDRIEKHYESYIESLNQKSITERQLLKESIGRLFD